MLTPTEIAARVENRIARIWPTPRFRVAPRRPIVSFTFDDIPQTALTNGARILEAHGLRGTFYVAGGLVDSTGYVTADGCRELIDRGHEIGCHTYAHRRMRSLSAGDLADDLKRNADFRASLGGASRARNFAFPYNQASFASMEILRSGFRSARAGATGLNLGAANLFHLRAVEIAPRNSEAELLAWIDRAAAQKAWLVFLTHDVSPAPSPIGTTPDMLERLVERSLARGCEVLTVDQALDRLGAPDAAG